MASSPRRLHVIIELLLAVTSLHLVFLFLFRRYPIPVGWLGTEFLPGALLVFALAWVRMWTDKNPNGDLIPFGDRWRPGMALQGIRGPAVLLLGCFLVVFFALNEYGGRVGNDGRIIYTYVRSLVVDKDLDLTNEFDEFVPGQSDALREALRTGGGVPPNELGAAFFWLPFFASTHALLKLSAVFGGTIPADGYSYPYIQAVCLASLLCAFAGVILSYLMARRYFDPEVASWGAVVLWLASPLFWYTVYEPSMPHAVSLAAVAMFLFSWFRARDTGGVATWTWVAFTAGVMVSVQRYNVLFLTAPLMTLLGRVRETPSLREGAKLRQAGWVAGLSLLAFAAATAPLWLYHWLATGSILRNIDIPAKALEYWRNPSISEFLFSSDRGLLSWTPAAYLSVFGLMVMFWRRKTVAGIFLMTLSVGVYLLSSTWDEGSSFGSRRLTEAYPIFLFGFCNVLVMAKRSPRVLLGLACLFLITWNFLLVGQVRRAEIPQMGTFRFSEAASRGVDRLYQKVGHPFAAPANWVFSWVYGVSPDRFDLVWGHRLYHNLTIDVGSPSDMYFVGKGWSVAERTSAGRTYRWSDGAESSWLVYLFAPYRYRLILTGEAAHGSDGLPQRIGLEINGNAPGLVSLAPGKTVAEAVVQAEFWKAGLNEIVFRYSYTVNAGEAYGTSDPRRIAVRLERLELRLE